MRQSKRSSGAGIHSADGAADRHTGEERGHRGELVVPGIGDLTAVNRDVEAAVDGLRAGRGQPCLPTAGEQRRRCARRRQLGFSCF